ncbi:MAG: alpha/beta hydrolase [Pseudomonadota bacterium]|nr:alpha/beta hydrolase [Pseudomonadota bacterium]
MIGNGIRGGMQSLLRRLAIAASLWLIVGPGVCEPVRQPPGELIDIGGYRLHLHCIGDGGPVVVLDSGLGGASSDWRKVQPALATTNRTCIYDRAGYGWSDSGPLPRTSARIAAELRTVLMLADLPPPFVLVGHSFGGYNARMFAGLFPRETAGLVLVDTPHEAQADALFQYGILGAIDPQGRLRSLLSPDLLSALPAEVEALAELLGPQGRTWYAMLNEAAAFDGSGEEVGATELPPDLPVGMLMHGHRIFPEGSVGDRLEHEWLQAQRDLAAEQRRSLFVIAEDSGHFIPADQPELIVKAVRWVIDELAAAP